MTTNPGALMGRRQPGPVSSSTVRPWLLMSFDAHWHPARQLTASGRHACTLVGGAFDEGCQAWVCMGVIACVGVLRIQGVVVWCEFCKPPAMPPQNSAWEDW